MLRCRRSWTKRRGKPDVKRVPEPTRAARPVPRCVRALPIRRGPLDLILTMEDFLARTPDSRRRNRARACNRIQHTLASRTGKRDDSEGNFDVRQAFLGTVQFVLSPTASAPLPPDTSVKLHHGQLLEAGATGSMARGPTVMSRVLRKRWRFCLILDIILTTIPLKCDCRTSSGARGHGSRYYGSRDLRNRLPGGRSGG